MYALSSTLPRFDTRRHRPAGDPGRIAIPVAGDIPEARATVMRLVDDTGFDALDAGPLSQSWRQQPGTPAYCTELGLTALERALTAADQKLAPATRDRLMAHFGSLGALPPREETVAINRAAHL